MTINPMNPLHALLADLAVVPSFSSFEERMHPVVRRMLEPVPGLVWHEIPDNNLVAYIPGESGRGPVGLSAHLDKINHFGQSPPEVLPFQMDDTRVTGQLDNSVGLAICIAVAKLASTHNFPPLLLLFSEMEEQFGLKHHPHLLKNGGSGLYSGIGAGRISRYLIEKQLLPASVMTVDTTPLFKGKSGVALYSEHWHFTGVRPGKKEKQRTVRIRDELLTIDPGLLLSNNTNDYLHYGVELNRDNRHGIPSLAIEPAIHPYHEKNESVYLADIERAFRDLIRWLEMTG